MSASPTQSGQILHSSRHDETGITCERSQLPVIAIARMLMAMRTRGGRRPASEAWVHTAKQPNLAQSLFEQNSIGWIEHYKSTSMADVDTFEDPYRQQAYGIEGNPAAGLTHIDIVNHCCTNSYRGV